MFQVHIPRRAQRTMVSRLTVMRNVLVRLIHTRPVRVAARGYLSGCNEQEPVLRFSSLVPIEFVGTYGSPRCLAVPATCSSKRSPRHVI